MKQKPRQQSGLCDISYARYSDKRFTDFYTEALYGDAMLMSLWEETNGNFFKIHFSY